MAKSAPVKKVPRKSTPVKAVRKSVTPDETLSPLDLKAIDEAVAFINARLDQATVSFVEIGEFLLKHFFGNDPAKASDRGPRKGVSLRKLAEHPDVTLTYSSLSRAVAVAVQERQLAAISTSPHVSASHRVLLLSIDEAPGIDVKKAIELKKGYLARVEKEKLSVRKLRDLLETDGYVKQRGMGAIGSAEERKLLRSGIHKLLDPIESMVSLDIKRLLALPPPSLKSTYDTARKARLRLDMLIAGLEQKLRG